MKKLDAPRSLSDADITSEVNRTRRSFLGSLGLGAGVAAVALIAGTTAASADPEGRGRRCGHLNKDSGAREDKIYKRCGKSDNDKH